MLKEMIIMIILILIIIDEGVDDGRCGVPPHGEADPHDIIVGNVLAAALDGGTRGLVLHLDGRA